LIIQKMRLKTMLRMTELIRGNETLQLLPFQWRSPRQAPHGNVEARERRQRQPNDDQQEAKRDENATEV
jgi:hypothetical protein